MSSKEERRLHQTLADMGERCQAIRRAIRGDWDRIVTDEVVGAATLYHLHVIGEAATSRLPERFKAAHSEIDWRGWAHFRHLTTHGYDRVDLERVRREAERAVPQIERLVQAELRQE